MKKTLCVHFFILLCIFILTINPILNGLIFGFYFLRVGLDMISYMLLIITVVNFICFMVYYELKESFNDKNVTFKHFVADVIVLALFGLFLDIIVLLRYIYIPL